jgi:hypothetical protein
MNERVVLVLSLALGLAGGAAGALVVASAPSGTEPVRAAKAVATVDEAAWRAELARLSARLDELAATVDLVADQRRAAAPLAGATPTGEDSGAPVGAGASAATETASGATVALEQDADWLVLSDPSASLDARQKAWASLRERGLLDQAIALMEARAAAAPDDPTAQFDVGVGYIEKIQEVGAGMEAGRWATKADKAFDRALALDEEHLDARLYKAMSLSFWPPIFGKRAEAIAQFETLIEKQATHPAQDHFASSYVLLGNLHMESGDVDKALEVWKAGAAAFPGDAELATKIAAAAGTGAGGQ